MSNCCVCDSKLSVFDRILGKCADGYVCRACRKDFPSVYKLAQYDSYDIKSIINYVQGQQAGGFECTSRMGTLYLDEVHGKIVIGKKGKDFPQTLNNIFALKDMIDLDISMTEPVVINRKVYCDVLMSVFFNDRKMNFQKILLRRVRCEYKWITSNQIQCKPPREYAIIHAIVGEMLNRRLNEMYQALQQMKEVRKEIELERQRQSVSYKASGTDKATAKAILMLDDNCSAEDIKKHYRQLIRVLHPDKFGEDGEEYTKKLNWAYDILSDGK